MTDSRLIDVSVKLHYRTEKAVFVSDDGEEDNAKWIPLSQCEINSERDGILEMTMPEWLAKDKGLI